MKWYWKTIIAVCSLAILLLLLNIGINFWIKFQLPKTINNKNNSAYVINYKKLEVSIWNSSIKADEIIIIPKASLKKPQSKAGIYAKINSISVTQFSLWSILFGDKIKAKSIRITNPEVLLYKKNENTVNLKNINSSVVAPFEKIIVVSDIYLYNGAVKIIYAKKNTAVLTLDNINLNIDGIVIDASTLKKKIPFQFKKYTFSCDSLYYHPNAFYNIQTKRVDLTQNSIKIKRFSMIPQYSRKEFVSKMPHEKDIFTLSAKDINIENLDWGFRSEVLYVNAHSLNLDGVAANIYRNKIPEDDLTKKKLYNRLLREIDFNLKVDTLNIRNSWVMYEEEKSFDKGAGKVFFNNFNLTATDICSGFKQTKLPDVKIKIDCKFMDASHLKVDWAFNVLDKSDGFHIKGQLFNFDVEKMAPFSKPYINVTTKGILNEVYFNFTGNDTSAKGDFALRYDDFKFTVYKKKDRDKKNKLLTAVGNLFVKNDSKGKVKDVEVSVERIQEKSFYNFLWRCVAEGLKKILI